MGGGSRQGRNNKVGVGPERSRSGGDENQKPQADRVLFPSQLMRTTPCFCKGSG